MSPTLAMSTTLSVTRWGYCAPNATAIPPPCAYEGCEIVPEMNERTANHGYSYDVRFAPSNILEKQRELHGVQIYIVRGLGRVRVPTPI